MTSCSLGNDAVQAHHLHESEGSLELIRLEHLLTLLVWLASWVRPL